MLVAAAGPVRRPVLAPAASVVSGPVGGVMPGQAIGLVAGVMPGQAIGLVDGVVLGQAIGPVADAVLGQAMVLVGSVVLGQAIGLVDGVVLGQAKGLVADAVLGLLARIAHPVGHESRVRLAAITPVLGVARPLVSEMIPVFEANPVAGANMLLQIAVELPAETDLLHIALQHPKAGVGIRRPKQRQMMRMFARLKFARLKNVVKTESDFRRCFRGLVSRRVVRLRTGFELGVSLSTAS